SVRGLDDLVALAGEDRGEDAPQVRLVVRDQDSHAPFILVVRPGRRPKRSSRRVAPVVLHDRCTKFGQLNVLWSSAFEDATSHGCANMSHLERTPDRATCVMPHSGIPFVSQSIKRVMSPIFAFFPFCSCINCVLNY